MAVSVTHPTVADGTFSAAGATNWNAAHTVAGLGDAAEKNTGTAAGTVAAGDHLHTGVYEPAGTVATHAAAADPHTGYQLESEKNAASGYAGLDASSKLTGSQQVYGTLVNTACQGNDARLSDSRTPTAHATSHKSGGTDAIKLDELAAPTDVTTLDASTTAHGLMMKYPGGTANFLRADGTFAAPTAAAADPTYSPGSFTVATETGRLIINHMKLTTTQRATLEGTGRLAVGF